MLGHGVNLVVMDAQRQMRTPRDVRGPWVRPRTPSKAKGRKGSRRRWKRLNAPHYVWLYREPEDALQYADPFTGQPTVIVTPRQEHAIRLATMGDQNDD